jgi:hypothetical protein
MSASQLTVDSLPVEDDFTAVIPVSSRKCLPASVTKGDGSILISFNGDTYLAEVLDWHDCWVDSGEPSYVYVVLV